LATIAGGFTSVPAPQTTLIVILSDVIYYIYHFR